MIIIWFKFSRFEYSFDFFAKNDGDIVGCTASNNGYDKKFGCSHKREVLIDKSKNFLKGTDHIFKAKDGFIALGIVDDSFWKVLTDIMGKPDLSSNPDYASISDRQKNSHSLNIIIENWTSLKTKSGFIFNNSPIGTVLISPQ